jgi:hypothetical protein
MQNTHEVEKMLGAYTQWLNGWNKVNGDTDFEYDRSHFGTPEVLLDQRFMGGSILEDRIIRMEVDSADDGGPPILTAWLEPTHQTIGNEDPLTVDWDIVYMVQEFDTVKVWVVESGKVVEAG